MKSEHGVWAFAVHVNGCGDRYWEKEEFNFPIVFPHEPSWKEIEKAAFDKIAEICKERDVECYEEDGDPEICLITIYNSEQKISYGKNTYEDIKNHRSVDHCHIFFWNTEEFGIAKCKEKWITHVTPELIHRVANQM